MSGFLLDTQTVILSFLSPDELPKKARSLMEDSSADRLLSTVSILEIGIKSGLGKLRITKAELQMAITDLRLSLIPFSAAHAFGLFRLPQRADIFDRMLVATALSLKVPIISGDRELPHYEGLKVIWK